MAQCFRENHMSAIADGVPVGFAIGKWHGVNQDVVADFEEDADFCSVVFHLDLHFLF
ncbi:MAG: hypothetical protein ACOYL3_04725 [Desulfuromonadaceae bacterium]